MSAGDAGSWSPPEGYEPLDSLLEGFEVYGPAPTAEGDDGAAAGPTTVRCPQCGASARFDVGKGAVACGFCGWADEAAPEVVGRDAADGEFTREALAQGAEGFGVDRRELACQGCGALIALEEGAMAASCPFCASPQVAIRDHATVSGLRPTAILPFAVKTEAARKTAGAWLGKGWFHPADLGQLARVDAFVGLAVPYWTFSAALDSAWEAEVGTERTITTINDEGETETETVIDWSWRQGSVHIEISDLLVPGTTKISARLLGRIEPRFELDRLVAYEPKLLAGFGAQTYDVSLPDAWEAGRGRMRERARSACMSDTGSSHVRNFSMSADLDDEAWRHVLLPVWISAYRYGDRTYVVLIDGSSGEVAGQKPIAWWKVWTAVALLLSPGIGLGLVGLPLLLIGVGAFVLVLAAVLLIAGAIGSFFLYQHAIESEAL